MSRFRTDSCLQSGRNIPSKFTQSCAVSPRETRIKPLPVKFSFCNKNLTQIPANLPENLTILYLGNNEINNLNGIEKYKNLEKLSLAFNKLNNLNEIEKIPKSVKILTLEGNPIINMINYRAKCINLHQNLENIDGVKISDQERINSAKICRKELELRKLLIDAQSEICDYDIQKAKDLIDKKVQEKYEKLISQNANITPNSWETVFSNIFIELKGEITKIRKPPRPEELPLQITKIPKSLEIIENKPKIDYSKENKELKLKLVELIKQNSKIVSQNTDFIKELSKKSAILENKNYELESKFSEIIRKSENFNLKNTNNIEAQKFEQISKIVKREKAEKFFFMNTGRRIIHKYYSACQKSSKINANIQKINYKLLKKSFYVLRRFQLIQKFLKYNENKRNLNLIRNSLQKLQKHTKTQKLIRKHKNKIYYGKAFISLVRRVSNKKSKRGKITVAKEFWYRKTAKKCLQILGNLLLPIEIRYSHQISLVFFHKLNYI